MPKRRRRTTNRVPQDERSLSVRTVRHDQPQAQKLSRAFIGLAMSRAQPRTGPATPDGDADENK